MTAFDVQPRPTRPSAQFLARPRPRTLALAWCHALLGGTAGLIALTFAVIPGLAVPGPRASRLVLWLAIALVLLLLAGLPRLSRRAATRLADSLLLSEVGVSEMGVAEGRSDLSGRARSGVWTALHAVAGGVLVTGTMILVGVAVAAPVVWLGAGDGEMTYLGLSLQLRGAAGLVAVPLALGHLALAVFATWGYAVLMRRTAPALLGPGAAERLAAERQRADALAHRNRLARELHDSIGHTLTAATLQAAAAGRLIDTTPHPDPALLRQTLTAIEESSRTALDDLDQALATLRTTPAQPTPPTRTLHDLPALFDRLRVAGLTIHTTDLTEPTDLTGGAGGARVTAGVGLPEAVSWEAYRIVQEGLTNALRYADPATVTVRLARVDPDRLLIELVNPVGSGDAPTGRGRGLAGITERVHLLRGDIEVGRVDDPGTGSRWRLAVRLPVAAP